jgi:hypothetical protein
VQQYPEVLDHYYGVIDEAVRNGQGVGEIIYGRSEGSGRRGERRMRALYE